MDRTGKYECAMTTYTHQPDGTNGIDAPILSDLATTNYNTRETLDVFGAATRYSSLWKNDFSLGTNPPPSNAVVSAATLYLYNNQADAASTDVVIDLYPVLRNWVESQCTWNVYATASNWGTAGCENTSTDRESTSIGTATLTNGEATGTEHAISLDTAKVQAWIQGIQANYGVIIRLTSGTGGFFLSSSDTTVNSLYRPKLIVEWSLPASGFFF